MKQKIAYDLPVTIFKEGKYFIAYSPVLDLSSAGKTEKQAKRMFAEAVQIFLNELIEMGTFDEVLGGMGWLKVKGQRTPPKLIEQSVMQISVPANA